MERSKPESDPLAAVSSPAIASRDAHEPASGTKMKSDGDHVPSSAKLPGISDPSRSLEGALHEVSNALTVLLGWVTEARSPQANKADVDLALRIVEQRARAARDLARRAIGVSIPLSGEASLDSVIDEVEESLRIELGRSHHRLVRIGTADGARVPSAFDVSQILTNLVLNAIAHAPPEGEIRLIARAEPISIEVDVQDDGPGVSVDRKHSIFAGDSQRPGGAGVGLQHARSTARAAGGDLRLIENHSPGATFRLSWPRVINDAPAPIRSVPRLPVLGGTRVFVLEDDADVTGLLESALAARGAEVTSARTHHELEARLDSSHNVILVDLSPIAADVLGAMALVRRQAPHAAIVFITGSAESLPEGLDGAWVRKPFEISEIVGALLQARASAAQSTTAIAGAADSEKDLNRSAPLKRD